MADTKEYRQLNELTSWANNPRGIKKKDYERLKSQLKRLGQYKPLVVTKDGVVLGGNMRLQAYRDLGIDKVWVSVVEAKTEQKKLEYALSDNDNVGYYEDDALAELVMSLPELDLGTFGVDLKEPKSLQDLMDDYSAPDVPGARDTLQEKEITCTHCGEKMIIVI